MAIERKPYIEYYEYLEKESTSNDSEIPVFIGKSLKTESKVKTVTKFTSFAEVSDINVLGAVHKYKFKKTSGSETVYDWFSSVAEGTAAGYTQVMEEGVAVEKDDYFVKVISDFCEENVKYSTDGTKVNYFYVIDLPNGSTQQDYIDAVVSSKLKKESTVLVICLEDDTYVAETSSKTQYKFSKDGSSPVEYVWFDDTSAHEGYTIVTPQVTRTATAYYNTSETLTGIMASIASELYSETKDGFLRIAYFGLEPVGNSGGRLDRAEHIRDKLSGTEGAQRISAVENPQLGQTVARICTTPYYVEPGYDAYRSIEVGTFEEKEYEFANDLFNLGILFNEDDYSLEDITPRICLATSCAFGVKDKDERLNDCLIHQRRNVDKQVRDMFKVVAKQLKRNETSTNIAFIRTDLINLLVEEKRLGRILDYEISVEESSSDAYKLLIYGKITPVNSTLGIEFSNYIANPVVKSSDYI